MNFSVLSWSGVPFTTIRRLLGAVGMVLLAQGIFALTPAYAHDNRGHTLAYDIAMNGHTFSFEGAANPNGFPADGTPFIIRGYIYPGGTFARHGKNSGVLPDGSPQFPDKVLGTWICRGWHLQDGDAVSGPVVATTQIFEFNARVFGSKSLVTDGIELADFDVPFERIVTGGTGPFRDAESLKVIQTYVDFNATSSFNTSFVLKGVRW